MHDKLFEAALGVEAPWYVQGVDFDTARKTLTIAIDFVAGRRFEHPDAPGLHPVHDTRIKRLRHLNFFQHENGRPCGIDKTATKPVSGRW
jgi:hypothetical protein